LDEAAQLQLFRPRLTDEGRKRVASAVAATHIIGDDVLCATEGRSRPLADELWQPESRWGNAVQHTPLLLFPTHSPERIKDRVHYELSNNAELKAVVILLTTSRNVADCCDSWESFAQKVDAVLVKGWGVGVRVSAVSLFMDSVPLRRLPKGRTAVPPASWETTPLSMTRTAVAITISREHADDATASFRKIGTAPSLADVRERERAGLVPVAVEVALPQRPMDVKVDTRTFCRRTLRDLVATAKGGVDAGLLAALQGVSQRGDMLVGFVDLPAELACKVVNASGAVRGVFARPMLGGRIQRPLPTGFTSDSHRVVWVKVERFSDVVAARLHAAGVPFAGLVCGRRRSEVGVRLPVGIDVSTVAAALEVELGARVKRLTVLPAGHQRTHLVARHVPTAVI
jgi:hypothetical protein